ncbi:MAG: GGDEF domain-containing protein [Clostridia bacterium]|nr:GGDEF domain-containing protein [Clostridia bacterium]MBQ9402831.1 GGDEF domain-containing protein [Clostridia bacterium]
MREKLRLLNQYGYETDIFDKYRDSVTKSNQIAVKMFSVLAIFCTLIIMVFGIVTKQPETGLIYCFLALCAGVYGAYVSFQNDCTRERLLVAGYFLCIATYTLSIYGAVTYKSDAFWIGTLLCVACYIFDYAWRVSLLQIASFVAIRLVWSTTGMAIDPVRGVFSSLYLVISLVTCYALNRARVRLIAGQQKSQYQADTDLLTGLTMRTAAQQMIQDHLKTDKHGVMMLLDLDRFKSVNDRLGHQMGDTVLIDVANDLKRMFRNSDVLSRLGGDEFVVYMNSVPEKEWAMERAAQVVRAVRRWVGNGTTNIQISASVGIVMTDMVERNYDELYRAADIAMYAAKSQGGNRALFYSPDMLESARETENARHLTREKVATEEELNSLR